MRWTIHHVNLPAVDVRRSADFYGRIVGLPSGEWTYPPADEMGQIHHNEDSIAYFGTGNRGLHIVRPIPTFSTDNGFHHNPTIGGHVAITIPDIETLKKRLDAAGVVYSDAGCYAMRGVHQVYVYDPSMNVVEFNQIVEGPDTPADGHPQPWEDDWGWSIHHVNLEAIDVRASATFLSETCGLEEGVWTFPPAEQTGKVSADPAELTIFPLMAGNRGLHLIRPDPAFGHDNGFVHNPSIGGHPALMVPDIDAVKHRLDADDILYSDAGVYAMPGIHQIYVYDPSMNLIEINCQVG